MTIGEISSVSEVSLKEKTCINDIKLNDLDKPFTSDVTEVKRELSIDQKSEVYQQSGWSDNIVNNIGSMEEYKIYEDDRYACYEISPLLYTDAAEYARTWLEATGQDGTYDKAAEQRLLNIYNYYKENAGRLMEYVE